MNQTLSQNNIEKIFMRFHTPLLIYAYNITADKTIAEDLVQDLFVKLLEKTTDLSEIKPSFLYVCVRNSALNVLRNKRADREIAEDKIDADYDVEFDSDVELCTQLRKLNALIDSLPPKCREVFTEVYIKQQKYATVAEQMGLSVHTVKAQMFMAMKKIKESFVILFFM